MSEVEAVDTREGARGRHLEDVSVKMDTPAGGGAVDISVFSLVSTPG